MVGKFEHFFRVGPVTSNRVTFSWPDQTEFLVHKIFIQLYKIFGQTIRRKTKEA